MLINETAVCNFANDTKLYTGEIELQSVVTKIQRDGVNAKRWLKSNKMVANLSKFQLMFIENTVDYHTSMTCNGKKRLIRPNLLNFQVRQ